MPELRDGRQVAPQWRFYPLASAPALPPAPAWLTVLGPVSDFLASYVSAACVGAGSADVNCRVTLDGVILTGTFLGASATTVYFYADTQAEALVSTVTVTMAGRAVPLYAQTLQVEMQYANRVGAWSGTGYVRGNTL